MIRAGVISLALIAAAPAWAQATRYGAIAYDPFTEVYGHRVGALSQGEAEAGALAACSKVGGACEIATWFYNACGALAVDGEGAWGSWWGETTLQAESRAMTTCHDYSETATCEVRFTTCSYNQDF